MKNFFFVLLIFFLYEAVCLGQKKEIDQNAIKTWEKLGDYSVSPDGKFVLYEAGTITQGTSLFISDATGKKQKEICKASNAKFSYDSRYVVFESSDSIHLLALSKTESKIRKGVGARLYNKWLYYSCGDTLCIVDMSNFRERRIPAVTNYVVSRTGSYVLLQHDSLLTWMDSSSGQKKNIFKGEGVGNIQFDPTGKRGVFVVNNATRISIYKIDSDRKIAELLVSDSSASIDTQYQISDGDISFNKNGTCVFFQLKRSALSQFPDTTLLSDDLIIWHYKDIFLQSNQLDDATIGGERRFTCVVGFTSGKIFQLENDTTMIVVKGNEHAILGGFVNADETYWNGRNDNRYRLVSYLDSKVRNFASPDQAVSYPQFSPEEKYITWFNEDTDQLNCYSLSTGSNNIIETDLLAKNIVVNRGFKIPAYGISGWLKHDEAIIAVDKYDIWQIYPQSQRPNICLTARYGRRNRVVLRPVMNVQGAEEAVLSDSMLVTALDDSTKENAFYKIKLSVENNKFDKQFHGRLFYFPGIFVEDPPPPKKALNASTYILQQQSDTLSPNLVLTRDFKKFVPISSIRPEKRYPWFRSIPIYWYGQDRIRHMGLLYVPEELDSTRKYPIIFNYYEERTNERFKYQSPDLSVSNINIPWYLSRGYLVFTGDIVADKGAIGSQALDLVLGAVECLTRSYSWIDIKKMGIQGISFGGYITNYIVTHTNVFSAAQSSAGATDFISGFGGLGFRSKSLQHIHEMGQINLGTTPWKNPDIYINNSPIFSVENVTTPLLIMHNKGDDVVSFSQAIEFFTALRRLGKRVWLLDYEKEQHGLPTWNTNGLDFALRQQQFFDHFLKGKQAPVWLTKGIPAWQRTIKSGFEIDSISKSTK